MTSFLNKKSSLILLILSAMIIALSITSVSAAYTNTNVSITFDDNTTNMNTSTFWGDQLTINGSGYVKYNNTSASERTNNGTLDVYIADTINSSDPSGLSFRRIGTVPVSNGNFTYTLDTSQSKILGWLQIYFQDPATTATNTVNIANNKLHAFLRANTEVFINEKANVRMGQEATFTVNVQAKNATNTVAKLINLPGVKVIITLPNGDEIERTTNASGFAEFNWIVTKKDFEMSARTDLSATNFTYLTRNIADGYCDNCGAVHTGVPCTEIVPCPGKYIGPLTCTLNNTHNTNATGSAIGGPCPECAKVVLTGPLTCLENNTHTPNATGDTIGDLCPECALSVLVGPLTCVNGHSYPVGTWGDPCPACDVLAIGFLNATSSFIECMLNNSHNNASATSGPQTVGGLCPICTNYNLTASPLSCTINAHSLPNGTIGDSCPTCDVLSILDGPLTCVNGHSFPVGAIGDSCQACAILGILTGPLTCNETSTHTKITGAIGDACVGTTVCNGSDVTGANVSTLDYNVIYVDSNGTFAFTAAKGQPNVTSVWFDSPWGYIIGQPAIIFWSIDGVADFTNKTVTLFYFSKGLLQRTEVVPASTIDVSTLPDAINGNYSAIGYHVTNFTQVHDELTVVVVFPEDTEYLRSEARNTTFVDPSNTSRRTTIEVNFPVAGLKVGVQSTIEIRVKNFNNTYIQSGEINILWDDLWSFNTDLENGVARFTHTYTQAGAARNITISFPGDNVGNRASTYKNVTTVARGTGVNIVVTQDPLNPFVGQEVAIGAAVNFIAIGGSPKYITFNFVENGVTLHSSGEIAIDKVTDFSGFAQYNYVYILPHTALTINAVFSGDADYNGATGTLANIVVNPAPTV